jgi:hypothetical protein
MIFFKPSNSVKFVKLTAGQKRAIPLILADVEHRWGYGRHRGESLKENLFLTNQPLYLAHLRLIAPLKLLSRKRAWGQPLTVDNCQ